MAIDLTISPVTWLLGLIAGIGAARLTCCVVDSLSAKKKKASSADFIGPDQFNQHQRIAILAEPFLIELEICDQRVDGAVYDDGSPVTLGTVLSLCEEGRPDALRTLALIRRRGYVTRRPCKNSRGQ